MTNSDRRNFLKIAGSGAASALLPAIRSAERASRPPNIVIVLTDDQGYADVGVYGAKGFQTPNLDRMAHDGIRFTNFYVAQAVCSASRTALLTGCYPNRIGILGALGPKARHGIHDREITIAQLVKQKEYATAIFGKWHLGHLPPFLPMRHGFDEYFGLPYSNDMWPRHPETPAAYPDLPLLDGDRVVELNPDMNTLTTRYTERAVNFIQKNANRPFFLYLAHSMPHVPLGVSDKFRGKSAQGLYGDVIMEIDWSVGQILDALQRLKLEENTLVLFMTDNGPWVSYGNHAGSASPLREAKGTTFEGGVRVPCIARWSGRIPAGRVCHEPAMTIDILPTLAGLVEAKLPAHTIDGLDIRDIMLAKRGAKSPHEALCFYWGQELQAVRSGQWKLHFPHTYRTLNARESGKDGIPAKYENDQIGLALYNLQADPGERQNLADQQPAIAERLAKTAKAFDAELQKSKREPGRV